MISLDIRTEVDRFSERLWTGNNLFVGAQRGTIDHQVIRRYLASVFHLISHTPLNLRRAKAEAEQRGLFELAAFYATKLTEEEGHDEWAIADLDAIGSGVSENSAMVAPAINQLLALIKDTIARDPSLYLGYIFFAEYLTVVIGPRWLKELNDHCGVPMSSMTVVANHCELDKEHFVEDLEALDRFVDDGKAPAVLASLHSYMDLYDCFCREICGGQGS